VQQVANTINIVPFIWEEENVEDAEQKEERAEKVEKAEQKEERAEKVEDAEDVNLIN